jgi:hypothetical protein
MHIKGNLLSMGDKSSFFWGGGGRGIFCFFSLLFSMCSHHVPKVFPNIFPKIFPIALGFYPIWFAKVHSHVYKPKRWDLGEQILFYFATWGSKRCF